VRVSISPKLDSIKKNIKEKKTMATSMYTHLHLDNADNINVCCTPDPESVFFAVHFSLRSPMLLLPAIIN